MVQIYKKYDYKIYAASNGEYIIHNSSLKGFQHTHVKNYKTCIFLIDLAHYKRIPRHLPPYLLTSLIRISEDEEYKKKIQELLDAKSNKQKQYYYNSNKGVRKKGRR